MAKRIKILESSAGMAMNGALVCFTEGDIVEVTGNIVDMVESMVRGGVACYEGDEVKKNVEPEQPHEDPDVHLLPETRTRGRKRFRKTDATEG